MVYFQNHKLAYDVSNRISNRHTCPVTLSTLNGQSPRLARKHIYHRLSLIIADCVTLRLPFIATKNPRRKSQKAALCIDRPSM